MEVKTIVVGAIATNCYLIYSAGDLVIIDPGDEADKILKEIDKIGLKPKFIILTHYHFDHVLASQEIRQKTGAKIMIHKADNDLLGFQVDKYLEEGETIKINIEVLKVIHSPGHSKGSICLLSQKEIFVGDLIFKEGYGRTDLEGGSEEDMENSLKKIYKILKPGMIIYSGHGDSFQYKK